MSTRVWFRWQDWVTFVAGLWLLVSPWALGVDLGGPVAWSAWILGGLVALVAVWELGAPASRLPRWINVALGICAILAPWALGFSSLANAAWNSVIVGTITVVLAGWIVFEQSEPQIQ